MKYRIISANVAFGAKGLIAYLKLIDRMTREMQTDYLVVGAFARDLLLTKVLGASPGLLTEDIDLGIYLPDWSTYQTIATELQRNGYRRGRVPHEYIGPEGLRTDLLPYGPVESNRTISFEQSDHIVLNMMGFQEAAMERVSFVLGEEITFHTPSPAGLILLKLIAWADRFPRPVASKHVTDIGLLLEAFFDGTIEATDDDPSFSGAFNAIEPPTPLNHSALVIGRQINRLVANDPSGRKALSEIYQLIVADEQATFVDQLSRPLVVQPEDARTAVAYLFAPFV